MGFVFGQSVSCPRFPGDKGTIVDFHHNIKGEPEFFVYFCSPSGTLTCEEWVPVTELSAFQPTPTAPVALKYDSEKLRTDLLAPSALEGTARVLSFGAKKYADHNWAKGFAYSRLIGAALRHLFAFMRGEDKDPESGLHHIDHLACCVMFLQAHVHEGLGQDDRRKTGGN